MVKKDDTFKFRLPVELLEAAKAKAQQQDTPLAHIIRQFLMEWVKDPLPDVGERRDQLGDSD